MSIMYDLELDKVIEEIKKQDPNSVLIQLPEGLKPKAKKIADKIKEKTGITPLIWMGSCFGSCDIPKVKVDMLIQWGHSKFI